MKEYKVRFINGDCAYIQAERITTDYDLHLLNFYTENDLVAKIPLSQLMYMGMTNGTKEETDC